MTTTDNPPPAPGLPELTPLQIALSDAHYFCGVAHKAIDDDRAAWAEVAEVLREVERDVEKSGDGMRTCPLCICAVGHATDCRLAALLQRAEERSR